MKIDYRNPESTADISSSRGSDVPEFIKLGLLTVVSVTALYVVLGWAVDLAVTRIDYDLEIQFFGGLTLPFEFLSEGEDQSYLDQVFNDLQDHESVPDIDYELVVLDEELPNAFAFPGGTIGVTSGLLNLLDGEIELAFVLAHELGHFNNRDHLRGMGRALGTSAIVSMIFGSQLEINTMSSLPLFIMNSSYSRNQEALADEFALALVNDVYGTTRNFDALFRFLEEQQNQPGWLEMFSTHPLPRNRITNLHRYAEQLNNR